MMAGAFRCDPEVAAHMSEQLASVRRDMEGMNVQFDRYAGAVGSPRVKEALVHFFDKSSDNRKHMGVLLDRASGLLRALAEGTRAVDADLKRSLEPEPGSMAAAGTDGAVSAAASVADSA